MIYQQIAKNVRMSWLLIFAFVLLVSVVGYVFARAYDNYFIVIGAIGFATLMSFFSYYYSDKVVLSMTGAREATREEFPHFVNSVEGLAIAAGMPVPKIYVMDDPSPNAFATGRDPEHAVVCATTGLLQIMNRVELEGVIGHEMSHIKNYDIRFMMLVTVMVGTISMLANWFWYSGRFGGYRRSRDNGGQVIFLVIGLVLAILAPISAAIVKAAVSRQREYLADASGAMLTRYPDGLASALEKIAANTRPVMTASPATAPLFISDPLKKAFETGVNLFSTHPPIAERVKRLREM